MLDLDGRYHHFADREDALHWLNEDEYSLLEHLIEDGEVEAGLSPPHAANDDELVPFMLVRR